MLPCMAYMDDISGIHGMLRKGRGFLGIWECSSTDDWRACSHSCTGTTWVLAIDPRGFREIPRDLFSWSASHM